MYEIEGWLIDVTKITAIGPVQHTVKQPLADQTISFEIHVGSVAPIEIKESFFRVENLEINGEKIGPKANRGDIKLIDLDIYKEMNSKRENLITSWKSKVL